MAHITTSNMSRILDKMDNNYMSNTTINF